MYESPAEVLDIIVPEAELLTYELEALTKLVEASWGEPVLSELTGLRWNERKYWTDCTGRLWKSDFDVSVYLWKHLMDENAGKGYGNCSVRNALKAWMVRNNVSPIDALFSNGVKVFDEWFEAAIHDETYMREWLGIVRCDADGKEL